MFKKIGCTSKLLERIIIAPKHAASLACFNLQTICIRSSPVWSVSLTIWLLFFFIPHANIIPACSLANVCVKLATWKDVNCSFLPLLCLTIVCLFFSFGA